MPFGVVTHSRDRFRVHFVLPNSEIGRNLGRLTLAVVDPYDAMTEVDIRSGD
jgi:hypothetical protein